MAVAAVNDVPRRVNQRAEPRQFKFRLFEVERQAQPAAFGQSDWASCRQSPIPSRDTAVQQYSVYFSVTDFASGAASAEWRIDRFCQRAGLHRRRSNSSAVSAA